MDGNETKCPCCGAPDKEVHNFYKYGSLIRVCKNCGEKYLDRSFREPALQGFHPKSKNTPVCIFGAVIFAAVFALQAKWFYKTGTPFGYDTKDQIGVLIISAGAVIGCILQLICNISGITDKRNRRFLAESEKRLQDPQYVKDLSEYGVYLPEKYRKGENDG